MHFALVIAVAVIEPLDAAATGRVVLRHGDLHAGAVGEFFGLLDEPLAKRL